MKPSRESNRERWPEFAEWLDGMRETFGDVKVLHVKFPDGGEISSKEYEKRTASQITHDAAGVAAVLEDVA